MDRLKGKITLITGGAGDIGIAAGELFVREGSKVMLVDVDEDRLKEAVRHIGGTERVEYVVADVTQEEQVKRYVAECVKRFGTIDVFLNNAGIEGCVLPITEYPVDDFDRVIAVNVRGAWLGLKYVIPVMAQHGGGSIVISSSVAGVKGSALTSAYITSKHAVVGMMKSVSAECGPLNIRINTVNPCPVEGRMMGKLEEGYDEFLQMILPGAPSAREAMIQRIPLGRYARPADIANLMLFLAGDESKFVSGSVHMVDGAFLNS
jgi:NAD(P)-dependent dehydrogenase (short-subunit alcohol dehydrogenase family)